MESMLADEGGDNPGHRSAPEDARANGESFPVGAGGCDEDCTPRPPADDLQDKADAVDELRELNGAPVDEQPTQGGQSTDTESAGHPSRTRERHPPHLGGDHGTDGEGRTLPESRKHLTGDEHAHGSGLHCGITHPPSLL